MVLRVTWGSNPSREYEFWATGVEGGPLQISADDGATMLALFESSDGHPMIPQKTGVAFSVDADVFGSFALSLPGEIESPAGRPLRPDDIVDFDLCWAYDLVDPWANQYELNCYDYDRVRRRPHRPSPDHTGPVLATGVVRRPLRVRGVTVGGPNRPDHVGSQARLDELRATTEQRGSESREQLRRDRGGHE